MQIWIFSHLFAVKAQIKLCNDIVLPELLLLDYTKYENITRLILNITSPLDMQTWAF